MNHSTQVGFRLPPISSLSGRAFGLRPFDPDFQSLAVAVGSIARFTALPSSLPSSLPLGPALRLFGTAMPCAVGNSKLRCAGHFCIDGESAFALAVGVGNNPAALSIMRRAGVDSTDHERPPGVACSIQVSEYPVDAESAQARRVFNDDPTGSGFCDDAGHLAPEAAALAVETFCLSAGGGADVLARKPSAHDIDSSILSPIQLPHILMARHVGPVFLQHRAAVRLDLAEGDGAHAGALQAEGEAADAAEQVEDVHGSCLSANAFKQTLHCTACARPSSITTMNDAEHLHGRRRLP
ncbi:MAG: hypothetical protein WA210_00855 [Burkholderiaceae bacterium]